MDYYQVLFLVFSSFQRFSFGYAEFLYQIEENIIGVELDLINAPEESEGKMRAQKFLTEMTRELMDLFQVSLLNIPSPMKMISLTVGEMVEQKFGQSGLRTFLVGYFFLRFFCPALTCPENTLKTVSGQTKRCCIIISKILQTAASSREFETESMSFANELVSEAQGTVDLVLSHLSYSASTLEEQEGAPGEWVVHIDSLIFLRHFLLTNKEKIFGWLTEDENLSLRYDFFLKREKKKRYYSHFHVSDFLARVGPADHSATEKEQLNDFIGLLDQFLHFDSFQLLQDKHLKV